MLKMTENGFQT